MDLIEAMRTTHACREYKTDPVPDDLILKVLDGARWAPSGSNKQPVSFLVVKDAAKRQALHDLYQPIWEGPMQKYQSGEAKSGFRPGFMERVDYFARHLAEVPVMIVVCVAIDAISAAAQAALSIPQPLTSGNTSLPMRRMLLSTSLNGSPA